MNRRKLEEEIDEWSEHFESENSDANYVLRFFVFLLIVVPGLGLLLAGAMIMIIASP